MKKIFTILTAALLTTALQAQTTTLDLVSKNLQAIEEAGDLYMVGDAEDKSWILEVLIEDYNDYGTYEDIIGTYTDATGEHDVIGSVTYSYDE